MLATVGYNRQLPATQQHIGGDTVNTGLQQHIGGGTGDSGNTWLQQATQQHIGGDTGNSGLQQATQKHIGVGTGDTGYSGLHQQLSNTQEVVLETPATLATAGNSATAQEVILATPGYNRQQPATQQHIRGGTGNSELQQATASNLVKHWRECWRHWVK